MFRITILFRVSPIICYSIFEVWHGCFVDRLPAILQAVQRINLKPLQLDSICAGEFPTTTEQREMARGLGQ
jgi:hypothetical protein